MRESVFRSSLPRRAAMELFTHRNCAREKTKSKKYLRAFEGRAGLAGR